jgi:exodeoxyribonuclease V gamma subunit
LRAWVRLLGLTAARPDRPWESVVIGRARAGAERADVTVARIAPLGETEAARARTALEHLTVLLDLYDRGMREPLPLACEASAAYAQAAVAGGNAEAAARAVWTSGFGYDKEDRQPEHLLVYGGVLDLSDLGRQPPRPDEAWSAGETSRFGQYARRLWDGLLALEIVSDR